LERKNGISVIVCCYNSATRLEHTLNHLFKQEVESSISWEIIVVDNNSTDNTTERSEELYRLSGSFIPFKVITEPNPGLSNARQAGFDASKYEIVVMVDDDNWLSSNYLNGVWNVFQKDHTIGMVGGLGIPELSQMAPDWFDRYAYCYATGPQTEDGNAGITEHLYGAGLALRLSILDRLKENGFSSLLSDRIGNSLMSGGDTELCFAYRMAGAKLYYEPSISFQHELPQARINWRYLRRLFHGFGLTKSRMDIYTASIQGKPIPQDGRLPFWFNRAFFLWKKLLKDRWILFKSSFSEMEGNDELLVALAKKGQIEGILAMRDEYISTYKQVYDLQKRLK
jgi:glycosyltransferase involved in cell wall biosynthesis